MDRLDVKLELYEALMEVRDPYAERFLAYRDHWVYHVKSVPKACETRDRGLWAFGGHFMSDHTPVEPGVYVVCRVSDEGQRHRAYILWPGCDVELIAEQGDRLDWAFRMRRALRKALRDFRRAGKP